MTEFFVSPTGRDAGNEEGTQSNPFLTIAKGVSKLKNPGDTLNLFGGSYVETVAIKGLRGTPASPIVIRSFKGRAVIEGTVPQFRRAGNDDWEPASLLDPEAVADEFVSRATFDTSETADRNRTNRGAFLDRAPYARLITHSRLEDLRAANQTFDSRLPLDDPRPGPRLLDKDENEIEFKNPWVYMGPGLFYNLRPGTPTFGRVHVRLSHTTHGVKGIADYEGETDPRKLRLAISSAGMTTLEINDSAFLRFENLSVRYGGEFCVLLKNTEGVVFDHAEIFAASHGVIFGQKNAGTVLRHCVIRGGMPPWYFRSDRKAEYEFKDGGVTVTNKLGKQTSVALFGSPNPENEGVEVHNCELLDAHDIIAFGKGFRFHHNWVDNLNDDSLFADDIRTDDLRVFRNVFTRCLSALSFAGNKANGTVFVYRNLFDLRRPTADHRPRNEGDKEVFRHGQFFKDGEKPEGPIALFHNTCLVLGPKTQAYFRHYANTRGRNPIRSFNNIFVAVDPNSTDDRAIAFLPPANFPGPTDGNCYFRLSRAKKNLFTVKPKLHFDSLEELTNSRYFTDSKAQYPPGYEANSTDRHPLFRGFGRGGSPSPKDDFRLRDESPAKGRGVKLPEDLSRLDVFRPDPGDPDPGEPDMGCYQTGEGRLRVGVDGRRSFPSRLIP